MYEKELVELSKAKVKYLVVGGIAIGLSGYPRFTHDLDIFAALDDKNLRKVIKTMEKLGYTPRVPVKPEELLDPQRREHWKKEKHMLVFSFFNSKRQQNMVDLLIYEPLNFEDCYNRRRIVVVKEEEVSVACPKDLLEMKKKSKRTKDLNDIDILEQIIQREEMKKKDD